MAMAQSQSTKKMPYKIINVCRVCGEPHLCAKNKHNLLTGKDSSVRPDYTIALEDITGRIVLDDGLPKAVCGSCRTLLQRYGRSKRDVDRIVSFVQEKAESTNARFRTEITLCAPTSPCQQQKRVTLPVLQQSVSINSPTPRERSLVQVVEALKKNTGKAPTDDSVPVPLGDDMPPSSLDTVLSSTDSVPVPQRTTKVIITTTSGTRSRILSGPLEKIASCLQRNETYRLPKVVMDIPGLDKIAIREVLKRVDKECQEITSKKFNSLLRRTCPSDLKMFSWKKVLGEWTKKAPTFLQFIKSASSISTLVTGGRRQRFVWAKICKMAMAGATLLRARSKWMTAPMYRNALVMQHGGAKKRCYDRLSRVGICVSRKSCLRKFKTISGSWDKNSQLEEKCMRSKVLDDGCSPPGP